jgi:hypothetical protein
MTNQEYLDKLELFYNVLANEQREILKLVDSEDFKPMTGIAKDLVVAQASTIHALMNIMSIRMGILKFEQVRSEAIQDDTSSNVENDEQKNTTETSNKPEQ